MYIMYTCLYLCTTLMFHVVLNHYYSKCLYTRAGLEKNLKNSP